MVKDLGRCFPCRRGDCHDCARFDFPGIDVCTHDCASAPRQLTLPQMPEYPGQSDRSAYASNEAHDPHH